MPKPVLPLPALTPAVAKVLDPSYQFAFAKLVGQRLATARKRLVAAHGDLYSQERVGRVLQQSQTWLSNLELAHRRLDTGALLMLASLYEVTPESLVRAPVGDEEDAAMRRWIREHRALQREDAARELARQRAEAGQASLPRLPRPRR